MLRKIPPEVTIGELIDAWDKHQWTENDYLTTYVDVPRYFLYLLEQ